MTVRREPFAIVRRRAAISAVLLVAAVSALAACTPQAATPRHTRPPVVASIPACPSKVVRIHVDQSRAHAAKPLSFTPTYAVLCRYSALPNAGKLVGSAVLRSTAKLVELRREIDSFTLIPAGEVFSCPADFGSSYGLYLGTATRKLHLTMNETGCQFLVSASGGYRNETIGNLAAELAALTK